MAPATDLIEHITRRATQAGVSPEPDVLTRCGVYVEILAKWNRKMNLTSLPLAPASDAAIDRLIIEPLIAARQIRGDERVLIDLGSGGGSPAIPLAIAAPWVQLTMVESREKKAAFLREAARATSLAGATALSVRIEDLPALRADVISARAIKLDDQTLPVVLRLLGSTGRLLWFRSDVEVDEHDNLVASAFQEVEKVRLPSGALTIALARPPGH